MTNPYGNLLNDKSQRDALEALLAGDAPSVAAKQDATIAAGRLATGSVARGVEDELRDRPPAVQRFEMVGDGVAVASAASISSSANTTTLTLSALPAGARAWRVGDLVAIPGAGAAGAMLVATITAVASSLSCTISVAASTTVSSVSVAYGTDNADAWQVAVENSIADLRPLYLPTGIYMISAGAVASAPAAAITACNRAGGWGIFGDTMYRSVIFNASTDYALDLSAAGCDDLSFEKFSVKTWGTGGGGGLKVSEGGNQVYDRFFMDGCGAGKAGLYLSNPYQVRITNSRFWHEADEFKGQSIYAESGHTLFIDNTFCSRQFYDGSCIYINDYKNVVIPSLTCESNASSLAAPFTDQTYIEFDNYCSSIWIGTLHFEGTGWRYGVRNRSTNKIRHMKIETIYAWQKDSGSAGAKDHTVVDLATTDVVTIGDIFLKVDNSIAAPTTPTTAYVVSDPAHLSTVRNIEVTGTNHATRPWKQRYRVPGQKIVSAGTSTTTPSAQMQITEGPGTYIVSATMIKGTTGVPEGNHARGGLYKVKFHDKTNDYTTAVIIGSEDSIGTNLPSAITITVSNAGLITFSTTGATSGNYYVDWDFMKLGWLPV